MNRLSLLGYHIQIFSPIDDKYLKYRLPIYFRRLIFFFSKNKKINWFSFNPEIKIKSIPFVSDRFLPKADIIISTWWSTSLAVGMLSKDRGAKINLVQGYEIWSEHRELVHASYNQRETTNIVVANYLKDIVAQYTDNPTIVINNAIDHSVYYIKNAAENRFAASVCMLYSSNEIKGSDYGIEVLGLVKEHYPSLLVTLFGVESRPLHLPEWINYVRNPDNLSDIYNQNAIFISNSLTEGMALTPLEAMACGCSLICTDIDGHKEYAIDGKTALLVDPKNVEKMVEKICFLIENSDFRTKLAENGSVFVKKYTWDESIKRMDEVIQNILQKNRRQ